MKTNRTQILLLLTLNITLVACSKTETSEFTKSVSEQRLSSPVPGVSPNDSMPSPSVIEESNNPTPAPAPAAPVVVVTNPAPAPVAPKAPVLAPPVAASPIAEAPVKAHCPVKAPVKNPEVAVVEPKGEIIYPEKDIPVCKLNIRFNGMGSDTHLALASAPKSDLLNQKMDGFGNLSSQELSAMRTAAEKMVSANGVQVMKDGQSFNGNGLPKGSKILIVTDGKAAVDVRLNGIGSDSQIYIMNVADKHNTVCIRANGVSGKSFYYETVKGDPQYVSRAMIDVNGSGAVETVVKVAGGHQSGINFHGNGMSDSGLKISLDGKNDSFVSVDANGISNSHLDFKIKGLDDTGLGIKANGVSGSDMRIELEGRDDVKLMMDVNGMSNNEVSGWLKAKSGAKVDPIMGDLIAIMPLP